MIAYTTYHTPFGAFAIGCSETGIVSFLPSDGTCDETPTALSRLAALQLDEYFAKKRREFTLPLDLRGTEFQIKVWRALCEIPYGETRTYGDIARAVGNGRACRAVGMANHRNPVTIIVPCHRVVAGNGIGGYGLGTEMKRTLLMLEAGG